MIFDFVKGVLLEGGLDPMQDIKYMMLFRPKYMC